MGCTTVATEYSSQELAIRPKIQACWQDFQECSAGQHCNSWNVLAQKDEAPPIGSEPFNSQALPSHQHFAILHGAPGWSPVLNWRTRYTLVSELGSGQTATVFKASTLAPRGSDWRPKHPGGAKSSEAKSGSAHRSGRKVALKRFNQKGTLMFRNELKALVTCGVHPHVIRLLESFEGGVHEDAMVLEYCNGGDIYELYASSNGCCMLETFVSQIMRQVVLALAHLVERGIEHRDVKPENLLLYNIADASRNQQAPLIKLADFGWAAVVDRSGGPPPAIPPEGVGSLWYAPPELNPPVKGSEIVMDELQGGKSDMWSVGVITYLLLTGHSPFHLALSIMDVGQREDEVMRLAALGLLNMDTKVWNSDLSQPAKDFILSLIKPDPGKRLSPADALNHPFLATSSSHFLQGGHFRFFSTSGMQEPLMRWNTLDSFQQLCWLAIARAFAEPELMEFQTVKDFIRQDGGSSGYIERLAAQLVSVASFSAMTSQAAWSDVLYLAFLYLDVDCDGQLGADDLSVHLPGGYRPRDVAQACIAKWRSRSQVLSMKAANFLTPNDFQEAVSSALAPSSFPQPAETSPRLAPVEMCQETMQERMQAIEEACRKLADDGFQEFLDLEGL